MKLGFVATITAALAQLGAAVQVSWDPVYDRGAQSLNTVACSNGNNGLMTKYGWKTFSNVPTFPLIGGSNIVAGWNSPNCGTCWKLNYTGLGTPVAITILVVDHADVGFNVGKQAMNKLTKNHAVEFGLVQATATKLSLSACGL